MTFSLPERLDRGHHQFFRRPGISRAFKHDQLTGAEMVTIESIVAVM